MADGRDNGLPKIDGESPSEFADCSVRISNDISGKKMKQILFDFSKNRKYNNYKRVASKRKSSLPVIRFLLLK